MGTTDSIRVEIIKQKYYKMKISCALWLLSPWPTIKRFHHGIRFNVFKDSPNFLKNFSMSGMTFFRQKITGFTSLRPMLNVWRKILHAVINDVDFTMNLSFLMAVLSQLLLRLLLLLLLPLQLPLLPPL